MIDILQFITIEPETTVYVLDSHRPLNLHNAFSSEHRSVVIFVELDTAQDYQDWKELNVAFEALEYEDGTESDENSQPESNAEDEGSDDENGSQNLNQPDEDGSLENENASLGKRKSNKNKDSSRFADRRAAKRAHQRTIAEYYNEGSSYSMPICGFLYKLAVDMVRSTPSMLWWNIASHTSHYILDRMGQVDYEQSVLMLKLEVDRITLQSTPETQVNLGTGTATKITANDQTIKFSEDLRLMLLKHWNLYDSMFYSTYVATKIGLWRETGRQRLTNLLVKMGFLLITQVPSKRVAPNLQGDEFAFQALAKRKTHRDGWKVQYGQYWPAIFREELWLPMYT